MKPVLGGLLLSVLLSGCDKPSEKERAIVVIITVDTLSKPMADQVGMCEDLQGILGEYGLDLACLNGAVAPSSWTGESHTRFLFPQNTVGDRRGAQYPSCGDDGVLSTIRKTNGGSYIFGTDNSVLGDSEKDTCSPGRTVFMQGADQAWETSLEPAQIAPLPEEDRPVHRALDAFEGKVKGDRGIQLFFNALEPGGHEPRCWFDPTTPSCDEIWDVAVTNGITTADADRRKTWLDQAFYGKFVHLFAVQQQKQEMRWRPLFWGMVEDAVNNLKEPLFFDRLRRILDATRDADRLGDLRLVVVGDHGENPCVARGLAEDSLNCGHNGVPTEYTAFVPVFVSPASLGQAWIDAGLAGEDGEIWSLTNMGRGLLADVDVAVPASWPAPEPPGTATSWICKGPEGSGESGVHIENGQAARCRHGLCDATTFSAPTDEFSQPQQLNPIPENLASWTTSPDWFSEACTGG